MTELTCHQCGTALPADARFCGGCGAAAGAPPTAPVDPATLRAGEPETDATGGLIPYKNVPALVGYYLGIGSLIPLPITAIPLGVTAIILGIKGLMKRAKEPHVRGKAHAIIAIVLGSIGLLMGGTCVAAIVLG